jgi:hypothetical protein
VSAVPFVAQAGAEAGQAASTETKLRAASANTNKWETRNIERQRDKERRNWLGMRGENGRVVGEGGYRGMEGWREGQRNREKKGRSD